MSKILSVLRKPISISKSFTIFLIYFSVFTLLISLALFFQHYQKSKDIVNQKLEYQAGRVENIFVDAIEYTESTMNFIAKQIADNNKQNDFQFIARLLESYKVPSNRIMELSTFSWTNEQHRYLVSSNKGVHMDQVLDLSKRDYMPKTISDPWQIHLGSPVFGIYSQKYSIPAGYGVIDKNGKYLGAVVTGFVISGLQRKFDQVIDSDGVSFVLVGKDGVFIAASSNIHQKDIDNQLHNLSGNTKNKSGILYDAGIFNNQKHGSIYYKSLEDYPYVILTIYNKNFQKMEIQEIIFGHIIVFLVLFFLVTILLFLFYKSLVKPIITLSEVARKISNKEQQDAEFTSYNNIEINQLSKSILSIRQFIMEEEVLKNKLKTAKHQLDLSNQKLQTLLKSISHDLRNYVFGISGIAQIIDEENNNIIQNLNQNGSSNKSSIDQSNILNVANQNKKHAQIIISQSSQIMEFAKDALEIDHENLGNLSLRKISDCNVVELLEEMLMLEQELIAKQQVKITIDAKNNIPLLKCDNRRLRQVLDNLITNAVKYSNKNSEVLIGVEYLNSNQILVTIKDSGIGMSKKEIKMALDGDGKNIDKSALDKAIDSHGIGMPIVKQIIDAMNAKMTIESIKGSGTTIKLWFDVEGRFSV